MTIQGEPVLEVAAGLEPTFELAIMCTAIPCVDAEQAHALRAEFGDGVLDRKG